MHMYSYGSVTFQQQNFRVVEEGIEFLIPNKKNGFYTPTKKGMNSVSVGGGGRRRRRRQRRRRGGGGGGGGGGKRGGGAFIQSDESGG
jgi:hypothetical protein